MHILYSAACDSVKHFTINKDNNPKNTPNFSYSKFRYINTNFEKLKVLQNILLRWTSWKRIIALIICLDLKQLVVFGTYTQSILYARVAIAWFYTFEDILEDIVWSSFERRHVLHEKKKAKKAHSHTVTDHFLKKSSKFICKTSLTSKTENMFYYPKNHKCLPSR